jgi:ABC-type transporter Mla subunit MlaD
MAEKISVQIALEGGAQVEKQLTGIGKAGETMADGIAKAGDASQTTGTNFDALVAATDKLTEATNKATEAHSKLSLETVKTSAEIAKLAAEIGLAGVEIVQAVRHHNTLIQTLIKLAGITNTTVKAVSLLTPELALVGVTIGSTVAAAAGLVVGLEALEKAATKAASGDEKLNHSLQMLAENSGQSFKSLQEGKDALEQLGIGGERFEGVVTKINEAMSSLDIGAKFTEGADNIAKAGALTSEHFKALANNMGAVLPLVKQIEEGAKGLTFDQLTTAQTKIDAVTASMKQAVDAGKNAGEALLQFIVNADKLSAIQVGKAFGITDEDVDRIRRLAASGVTVAEIFKRIQGTGVLISPESAAAFDKMRDSIAQADSAWVRFKQSLASTIFSTLGAQASSALNDIKATALNTAAAIVETFNSAATQAIAALKRIGQSDWGQAVNQTLQNAVTGLNSIIANMVGTIMRGMGASEQAIKAVQDQINGVGQAAAQAGQQAAQGLQLVTNPLTGMPELINTTNQALQQTGQAAAQAGQQGAQGFQVWNEELGKAVPATQQVTTATQTTNTTLSTLASTIAGWNWDPIAAGVRVWNDITAAIQSAIDKFLTFIGLKPSTPATGGSAPGAARGGMIGGWGTRTSDSNLAWLSRGEFVVQAAAVRKYGAGLFAALNARRFAGGGLVGGGGTTTGTGGVDQIVRAIEKNSAVIIELGRIIDGLVQTVGGLVQTVGRLADQQGELVSAFNDLMEMVKDGLQATKASVEAAAETIKSGFDQFGQQLQEGRYNQQGQQTFPGKFDQEGMQRNARGGLLGGRGSGTSDSNLAWVSRGEHIMPARAVAQPGVLAFLEALRRSGGNLRSVLDGMGRFALGGMVPRMPAFAAGGLAGGMSNVTIQFPGLPAIDGLRASSAVVDELHRAAALAQVRSGGRKPSRYS